MNLKENASQQLTRVEFDKQERKGFLRERELLSQGGVESSL